MEQEEARLLALYEHGRRWSEAWWPPSREGGDPHQSIGEALVGASGAVRERARRDGVGGVVFLVVSRDAARRARAPSRDPAVPAPR